jgi:MurNAc alpha-1-phosphate uridylyltransferase
MSLHIDTAMVLAAGLGTRMRPLSADRPKPMIEVGGKALIDHMLDKLAADGVMRAVVNVHYRADQLEAHLAARQAAGKGPEIVISDERAELLETGGALVKARHLLGDRPIFVMNTDQVWLEGARLILPTLREAWDAERMDALLMLAGGIGVMGYQGAGDFTMDPVGRVARRRAPFIAPFVFAGVYILDPQVLDGRLVERFSANRYWDDSLEAGRLYGRRFDGRWMHVGDPRARREADLVLSREQWV